MLQSKRKPWKKNLYENEGYPDNYTDPSFLKDLQKNINVQQFTLTEVLFGATRLNLQISLVTSFLIVFYLLYMEKIAPEAVILQTSLFSGLGYIIYRRSTFSLQIIKEDSKTVVGVLVFGYLFSPILHTLTESISTDSIYTMTFFVMFLHLLTFDYGIAGFFVSRAISLNAALFGAICLSSRLSTTFHAFVLLVTSIVFFALGPIFFAKNRSIIFFIIFATLSCCQLVFISYPILITFLIGLVFINLICPLIFINLQKYKNNIHGPWDEAIVKDIEFE